MPTDDTTNTDTTTTAPNGTPDATSTSSTEQPATGEPAFPANTPVAEMTTPQQVAYWKASSRKHEQRTKTLPSPDEVKKLREDAAELDKLRQASMGEQERAVTVARAEATAATARTYALRLVAAEFRAATAGRLAREQLTDLLDPMDLGKFIADDGEVDTAKVNKYAAQMAPNTGAGKRFPDLGQGARATTATPSVESGRAAYAAKNGKKTT